MFIHTVAVGDDEADTGAELEEALRVSASKHDDRRPKKCREQAHDSRKRCRRTSRIWLVSC